MLNLDKLTHNSFESFSSLFFTYFFTIDVYSSTIIDKCSCIFSKVICVMTIECCLAPNGMSWHQNETFMR